VTLHHAGVSILLGALTSLSAASLPACSFPPSDSRFIESALPDEHTFPPVLNLLSVRCGSVDCHGTIARNLRIYGSTGMRWLVTDRPYAPVCNTPEEDEQSYFSVVGLEPEAMSEVVSGGDPSLLTMVRKARGTESHKGGQIWATGDDSDTCLTSWLIGKPRPSDCANAVAQSVSEVTRPTFMCCFGSDPLACAFPK
jgi:hypothetical protein